ncbi:oxidoreductase [Liquorilactobacillus aquaticus]|nr:oxidoreductase [Liquorilactobacillus aquaticus]
MFKDVWFITGASTGLGKELVQYLLKQNCRVVATSRNPSDIIKYIPKDVVQDNLLVLPLDVTNIKEIQNTVKIVLKKWNKVDVLVNNAGYAYFSSVEFANNEEARKMFDVNFWGVKNVLDSILPVMRKQHHGHIMNVSSLGGLRAFAGFGYYHATKFALEGITESLALEVKPLGIDITLLEPGDFKTDFAGRSAVANKQVEIPYEGTAGVNIQNLRNLSGNQPGDPKKFAKVVYEMHQKKDKPFRLLLGSDAYERAIEKLDTMQKSFKKNRSITSSTDY